MPKNVYTIPTGLMESYNTGYSDGYHMHKPNRQRAASGFADSYDRAYITGYEDRLEDQAAIASGDWTPLTKEEMDQIYGEADLP